MILAKKLLLSDPDSEDAWRHTLQYRKKKPLLYVLCIHPDHVYPVEIMSSKELYRAEKADIRYRVIGISEGHQDAVLLFQKAVEEILKVDPELAQLKNRLQEMYI